MDQVGLKRPCRFLIASRVGDRIQTCPDVQAAVGECIVSCADVLDTCSTVVDFDARWREQAKKRGGRREDCYLIGCYWYGT